MTAEHIQYRTANEVSISLNKNCTIDAHLSYNVEVLLTDMEFDPVPAKIPHVYTVNTVAAREHVVEIEREIRLVKERKQATLNTLTLRAVPKQVIIKLVYLTALWINTFSEKKGISKMYSPREIISVQKLDFKLHLQNGLWRVCQGE